MDPHMRRVYANGQIGLRIIYSGPWIGSTLAHSFCCRTTSSESFDFFSSLQYDNNYLSNITSIYLCINSFHWILLCIEIERARVTVFDSLRKPKEEYQDLINIMQKAWARFLKKYIGIASTPCELEFNTNFSV